MIFFILATNISFALDLYLGSRKFTFHENQDQIKVSQHCLKNINCMANNSKNYFFNQKSRTGGKNPASQFCGKAKVAILSDKNKNQFSVCYFEDESMSLTGSVFAYIKRLKN